MKNLFVILSLVTVISGCAAVKPSERIVLTAFSDYRKYSAEGFLISPNAYTSDFDGLGELSIMITPAKVKKEVQTQYSSYSIIEYEIITYDEMVEIAVKTAKEKGADAIVNFSIIKDKISEFNRFNGVYITGNTYYIQGYCIKRK